MSGVRMIRSGRQVVVPPPIPLDIALLSNTARRVYVFIVVYLEMTGGVSPTFQQIADACELGNKGRVVDVIRGLEQRGYLSRRARCTRSLTPLVPLRSRVLKFDEQFKRLKEVCS